jgi:transcriptional regulator with XRE-family HTH domain
MNLSIESLNPTEYRKILRYRLGLTQAEMAKRLGFSAIYYQLWENGKRGGETIAQRFAALTGKPAKRPSTKKP